MRFVGIAAPGFPGVPAPEDLIALGLLNDPVYVDFTLEAKYYAPRLNGARPNPVGGQ